MSISQNTLDHLEESASFIRGRIGSGSVPLFGVVLGTGLSGIVEQMEVKLAIPYSEIPHFPQSSVQSHLGRMLLGTLAGKSIIVLQGRVHTYEGVALDDLVFPVRLLHTLGIQILFLTNAAGGLNTLFSPGDVMVVTDHINLTGQNPLVGPNIDELGERFPDMTRVYDRVLLELADLAAIEARMRLQKGVYVGVLGPSMETPAETRMLRLLGADAVGMSTIPEVIAAVHCGLRVMVMSAITNVNRPDCMEPAPLETIIANAGAAGTKMIRVLEGILSLLPEDR